MSFVSESLQDTKRVGENEEGIVRDCAALAYGAGSDTVRWYLLIVVILD